jgi:hypothetical protein
MMLKKAKQNSEAKKSERSERKQAFITNCLYKGTYKKVQGIGLSPCYAH